MKKSILIAFYMTIGFSNFMHGSNIKCESKKQNIINLMLMVDREHLDKDKYYPLLMTMLSDAFEECMKDRYSDYSSWDEQKKYTMFQDFHKLEIRNRFLQG